MSLDDRYKINTRNWVESPLSEISQMLDISNKNTSKDHTKSDSTDLVKITAIRPWFYDQYSGFILNHLSLLDDLFLGRDVQYKIAPWGSVINWGHNHLNLYPAGQRCRTLSQAQQAMYKHDASIFFERWYDWVHDELKLVVKEKEEYVDLSKQNKGKGASEFHLYAALRKAALRVIARTVCASFVGDVIDKISSALEEIDVAGARLLYCGKGSRPAWFPGSENKVAQKGIKSLDALIRPLIRKRLAGEGEDDLLSRWVNTQGEDGRHLNEDQIISEAFCFLIMSYTSLPKIIFSAAYEMAQSHQESIRKRLQKEHDGIIEVLTPPPGGFPIGTPLPQAPTNTSANRTLPLHTMISLEAMRLYPPAWLVSYAITHDATLKKVELKKDQHLWISSWALHRNERRFKQAHRFWPQRWAGQLESQLPKFAFSPFGLEEKPSLSETFCKELVPRFLMVWFAHFEVIDASQDLKWALSLCLRPDSKIDWQAKSTDI
jgi:cytochrome P450